MRTRLFTALLLCLVLAAYSPMASFANAQTAADNEKLKQRIIKELDRRIAVQQKALDTTKKRYELINKNYQRAVDSNKQMNDRLGSKSDLIEKTWQESKKTQDKVLTSMQKTTTGLKNMRNQVGTTSSSAGLKTLAKNIDAQYGLNRIVQVQGAVVVAIDNAKAAADTLQTAIKNHRTVLQKQLTCLQSSNSDSGTDCTDYVGKESANEETNQRLTASLNQAAAQSDAYTQVIDSSLALFNAVTDGFASVLKAKLGVQASNLDQLNRADVAKLASTSETADSLQSSLRAIVGQLNVANTMLKSASSYLKSASTDQ